MCPVQKGHNLLQQEDKLGTVASSSRKGQEKGKQVVLSQLLSDSLQSKEMVY